MVVDSAVGDFVALSQRSVHRKRVVGARWTTGQMDSMVEVLLRALGLPSLVFPARPRGWRG